MQYEDKLTNNTFDMVRAIDSLNEEMEAVNAYRQRAEASSDEHLKKILLHHAKEEKEHAAMLIEWIRRQDNEFSEELKEYVFSEEKDISNKGH